MSDAPDLATLPAVAPDLFTWPSDRPALIGARCTACACVTFPQQPSCPRCAHTEMVRELLPRRGPLWTWTVQAFPPKSPPYSATAAAAFTPYGVGYVQLGDVRVEGRLTEHRPEHLRIGDTMQVVAVAFGDAVTYAFAPAEPGDE